MYRRYHCCFPLLSRAVFAICLCLEVPELESGILIVFLGFGSLGQENTKQKLELDWTLDI